MAVDFARACQFPEDLDNAFLIIEEDFSDRLIANEALLDLAIADIADLELDEKIDEVLNEFENILRTGDGTSNIRSLDDLSETMGIPKPPRPVDDPSDVQKQDEETFLFDSGILLFDGILYIPGEDSADANDATNISKLRDLYEANDRNLDKTTEFLTRLQIASPLIVQSELILERFPAKVPNKEAFTLDDIIEMLDLQDPSGPPVISTFINDDFSTVVLRKKFLGTNLSKKKISDQFGVEDENLITEVFHLNEVVARPKDLKAVSELGYTTTEVSTMFRRNGTDSVGLPLSEIEESIAESLRQATLAIQIIDFFLERVERSGEVITTPTATRIQNRDRLNTSIEELKKRHRKTISSVFFKRVIINDTVALSKLRENHSDTEIKRLLERRTEVEGIKFDATVAQIFDELNKGLQNSQPGSKLSSSQAQVRALPKSVYDLNELLFMWSDLIEAQDDVLAGIEDPVLIRNLLNAKEHLVDFIGKNPIRPDEDLQEPVKPFQGQRVIATPSGILLSQMDFDKTFGTDGLIEFIRDVIGEFFGQLNVGLIIGSVIDKITDFFKRAIEACSVILNKANNTILSFKKKIDAMVGYVLNLIGEGGEFDSSLLKCAVSLDISFSLDSIIGIISNLLCVLTSLIGIFLGKFSDWIADMINQILCMPLGLINAFIGTLNSALDPISAVCQIPTIDLGVQITNALINLKTIGDSKKVIIASLGDDLNHLKMFINGLPDKLSQFSGGANCNKNVEKAYNAAVLNIQASLNSLVPL